jgi:hypothetical protein
MSTKDLHPIVESVLPALGENDDADLWQMAVSTVLADSENHEGVRHLLVTVVRTPDSSASNPEERADLRLSWARAKEQVLWEFVGHTPRVRRRRGHFVLTICVPKGSRKLAYVDVTAIWRPRFPWAPPEETEVGRKAYAFARDAEGAWGPRGVHRP